MMTDAVNETIKTLVVDDDESILELFDCILRRKFNIYPPVSETKNMQAELIPASGEGYASQFDKHIYELKRCRNGVEAVETVRAAQADDQPYAMAFIDVRMPPGPDGIWTAENIRAISPDTQIVIVTGFNDIDPDEIEKRVPPPDRLIYLQKPFHPFEICQFVSTLSARWKAEKMMHAMNRNLESMVKARTAELQKAYKKLEYQATHDPLTDLLNRRAIFNVLKREIARSQRKSKPISVIMADIDHFKSFNDTHGHHLGDAVLVETAERLIDCIRPYDSVGRIGGEEFLIVLPECELADAVMVAERIRAAIGDEEIELAGMSCAITLSLGVATATTRQMMEQDSLISLVDKALYCAKRDGRNKIKVDCDISSVPSAVL